MAMINCPECGHEISDKAKKCVHCGAAFVEEARVVRFCIECGSAISPEMEECQYCGCPIERAGETPDETSGFKKTVNSVVEKIKSNKLIAIIAAAAVVLVVAIVLIVVAVAGGLNADEQLAYENAMTMKNMMKDPDSFRLYDEMYVLKHFDESGDCNYSYTVFKYGGANGYGAIISDEAIFKNDKYIMDYSEVDEEYDTGDIDEIEAHMKKLGVVFEISNGLMEAESYGAAGDLNELFEEYGMNLQLDEAEKERVWEKVDIDIEKIKSEMGLD